MIRDFLNTEDDLAVSEVAGAAPAAEAAVRIRLGQPRCDYSAVDRLPVGMAYAPMQAFRELYTPEEALCRGTLFRELDLPFRGGKQS